MRSSAGYCLVMGCSLRMMMLTVWPLLLLATLKIIAGTNVASISSDQVIQVNTTEAFFLSIKTSDYFTSSGHGISPSNQSIGSIDGTTVSSTVATATTTVTTMQPSTLASSFLSSSSSAVSSSSSSSSSSSVRSAGAEVELLMSVSGRADLPDWMYYKFDKESNTGYLYGSPVTDGDIEIEIIALNSHTYDTTMDTLKLTVVERERKANYEVEMKLVNLNVLDIFKGNHLDELLAIYKGHLWKESSDVYVTRIVSPSDVGGRLPVDPRDKEGVIIRIGSTGHFSTALLDLEREVNVLKNRNPCPKRYKATSVEHLFHQKAKHEFFNDWCSFQLIREPGDLSYNLWHSNDSIEFDSVIIGENSLDEHPMEEQIMQILESTSFDFENGDLKSDTSWLELIYSLRTIYSIAIPLVIVAVIFVITSGCIFYPICRAKWRKIKDKIIEKKELKRKSLSFMCQASEDEYRAQINSFFGYANEPIVGYPPSPYAYLSSIRNRSFLPNNPLRFDTIRRVQFQLDPLIYSNYPQGQCTNSSGVDESIYINPLVSFDTSEYMVNGHQNQQQANLLIGDPVTINDAMDELTLGTFPSLITSSSNHLQMTSEGLTASTSEAIQFTLNTDPNLPPPPPFPRAPFKSPPLVSTL